MKPRAERNITFDRNSPRNTYFGETNFPRVESLCTLIAQPSKKSFRIQQMVENFKSRTDEV